MRSPRAGAGTMPAVNAENAGRTVIRSRSQNLLLRGAGPQTAYADWLFLATFTVVCGVLTKVLFRREV